MGTGLDNKIKNVFPLDSMDLLFLFGPDDISNVRKIKKGNESWNQVFPNHQMRIGKNQLKCIQGFQFKI